MRKGQQSQPMKKGWANQPMKESGNDGQDIPTAYQSPDVAGGSIKSTSKKFKEFLELRPYTIESSRSRPISEDKRLMAQSVLRWETTREYCVL